MTLSTAELNAYLKWLLTRNKRVSRYGISVDVFFCDEESLIFQDTYAKAYIHWSESEQEFEVKLHNPDFCNVCNSMDRGMCRWVDVHSNGIAKPNSRSCSKHNNKNSKSMFMFGWRLSAKSLANLRRPCKGMSQHDIMYINMVINALQENNKLTNRFILINKDKFEKLQRYVATGIDEET